VVAKHRTPGIEPPGWTADPDGPSWPEWQELEAPLVLPPDHPSAPMPRVRLSADYPLEPLHEAGGPGAADLPHWQRGRQPRTWSGPRQLADRGHYTGSRRPHPVSDGYPAGELPSRQGQRGPAAWGTTDYQRRVGGPFAQGPESASWQVQNRHAADQEARWAAAQVLALADGRAAQITQDAEDNAAAIRDTAERRAAAITQQAASRADEMTRQATAQAAAIREAAEQEATQLRARLDQMSGELGRVAAYVTEHLAAPATPAVAPPRPDTRPARPGPPPAGRALPDARPRPGARQPRQGSTQVRPDTERPKPAARPVSPARPKTAPAAKPQQQPRQVRAIRIAKYGTATLLLFSVITGAAEIGLHGYKFFVFRAGGVGQTPGNETDQQFLAREAAAAHHHPVAPKGRHHRK
jgi:hypothetical protein